MLDLAHAAPVVRVAEHDLDGVLPHRGGQVGERRDRDVRGQRRVLAGVEQRLAHGGHAVHAGARILEIAAAAQLAIQRPPDLDRGRHRPRAVGIDAQRHVVAEGGVQRLDRRDLDRRVEHPGLQLDLAEAVGGAHLLRLADHRLGRQALAVLVGALVVALAAAAGVLVEQVGRERHGAAGAAAEQVADRAPEGAADQVEAGQLDRREQAVAGVERVLAGDAVGLRSIAVRGRARIDHRQQRRHQREGVLADQAIAQLGELGGDDVAAVRLAEPDEPAVADQLEDRAERVGLVQAVGAAQRRIGDGDRVDAQIGDRQARVGPGRGRT